LLLSRAHARTRTRGGDGLLARDRQSEHALASALSAVARVRRLCARGLSLIAIADEPNESKVRRKISMKTAEELFLVTTGNPLAVVRAGNANQPPTLSASELLAGVQPPDEPPA
jgi:hypothetical protein